MSTTPKRGRQAGADEDPPRYERKFVSEVVSPQEAITMIKLHPALFREAYPPRQVNSIYLDTYALGFFQANQAGIAERVKVRLRWYGSLADTQSRPFLEYKIKHGLVGTKRRYNLPAFRLGRRFASRDARALFERAEIEATHVQELSVLEPVVLVSYQRYYFVSADGSFRVTVDSNMRCHPTAHLPERLDLAWELSTATVLELKYPVEAELKAPDISGSLPFRLERNSKYVNAVVMCHAMA